MLSWMLFSIALGTVLAISAALAEPLARRTAIPTRFLWLLVAVATIVWSVAVATGGARGANRGAIALGAAPTVVDAGGTVAASLDVAATPRGATLAPLPPSNVQLELLLLALWLLGSVACMATLAFSAWRIARMRRQWTPTLVAGVPVLVSHDVGPAVVGVVHHGIVVPAWVTSLDESSQRLVMLHEREHVRAGDPLLLWGATLLVALMPWNAALWFALRRTRHAIEMDCDARVLRRQPDAHRYCSLLVDVGGRTLAGVSPAAALAEPSTLLERRVEAMLSRRALGYRHVAGAVVAVGLVVAACRAPHPAGLARIGVTDLAHELSERLATERGRAALSSDDRWRLGQALGFIDDAPYSSPVRSIPPEYLAEIDASDARDFGRKIDAAIGSYYPELGSGTDRTPVLVGFVFDDRGRVIRHAIQRGTPARGDAATLLRAMGLDTVSARTNTVGTGRRFGGRVIFVFATERGGPARGVSNLPPVLTSAQGAADTSEVTLLGRRPNAFPASTSGPSVRGMPPAASPIAAPVRVQPTAQDSITPLADSVVRAAVAKHFPGALTAAGQHPYFWFAADRSDGVLRSASGREGLIPDPVGRPDSVVTWGGAARMLSGMPFSAHPGDVMFFRSVPVERDTIMVVWVRLWRGLSSTP